MLILYMDFSCTKECMSNIYDDFVITRENIPNTIKTIESTYYLKNTSTHSLFDVELSVVDNDYDVLDLSNLPNEIQSNEVIPLVIKTTRNNTNEERRDVKIKLSFDYIVDSDKKSSNTVERLKVPIKYIKGIKMLSVESSYFSNFIYIKDVYGSSKTKNSVKVNI